MPNVTLPEPIRLGVFVLDARASANVPVERMPLYAEVSRRAGPPVDPRLADDDGLSAALREVDPASAEDESARVRIVDALAETLSATLTESALDALVADRVRTRDVVTDVLGLAREAAGRPLAEADPYQLRALLADAAAAVAARRDLATRTAAAVPAESTYPLGMLATDHAGYASFDLSRLPADLRAAIGAAIQTRRDHPEAVPELAVWLYPAVGGRYDALDQGRRTDQAIVARLLLPVDPRLREWRGLGLPSMQSPAIVDWRLSPASFALNPAALVGSDGCQSVLPANLAVQQFHFYQAVGLSDASAQPPGLGPAGGQVRAGLLNEYRMGWYQLGHSLGQIQYSLPLAPGESVNLAVIDWSRADDTVRTEDTKLTEELAHQQHRERAVSETVDAALREYQRGSSSMSGLAASAGGSASVGVLGGAVGLSGALGAASSNTQGSRDLSATTVQRLSDSVTQASAAMRELRSTVVVHATQAEREVIETRTVVNYNHSHALTILYYEVLRHFRVATELVRRRPAVLVRVPRDWLAGTDVDAARAVLRHRHVLRRALLDERYAAGLDAVERWLGRGGPLPALTAPAPPAIELRYFTFEMTVGGIAVADRKDGDVDIQATLFGPSPIKLVNQAGGPSDILDPPGAFAEKNVVEKFVAMAKGGPVRWHEVDGIAIGIHVRRTFVSFSRIRIIARDTPGRVEHVIVDQSYEHGHLVISESTAITLPLLPPPAPAPAPGHPPEVVADQERVLDLLAHLRRHVDHYSRAVLAYQDPAERALSLATIKLADGSSVGDHVENRVVEFVGDQAVFPCVDPVWSARIQAALDATGTGPDLVDERLVTLPTRGVFAEAKLGSCNASEEIDMTRFWDWQQSPIPHLAPEIAPLHGVVPQPQQQAGTTPTAFPSSLVNIVNPAEAPNPTGLAAALGVLATPNIFRDMSGRAEVADLLKALSDNTIDIATAGSVARGIQQRYGGGPGAGGGAGGALGAGGGAIGGARARANEPSAANRDLHDLQQVLGQATQRGLLTPEAAQDAYASAVRGALEPADLVPASDVFARPATNPNHLIGLVGEQILAEALRADGLVVFYDWRKHVTGSGIDLVAYHRVSKTVWLLDNKAQLRGIAAAESLTGPQFAANKAAVRDFLSRVHPDPATAAEAVRALDEGRYVKVVANGWAGKDTRFTSGLLKTGLSVYDLRMRPPGLFGDQATWAAAFKSLPKPARRVVGVRGAITAGGAVFGAIVSAGLLWVLRSGEETHKVLGELAAETALGAALSRLPGGYFASMVIGLESDETPAVRRARLRRETIEQITAAIPGISAMSKADQGASTAAVESMIDDPIVLDVPAAVPPPKQLLPGLPAPGQPIWT